MAAPVYVVVNVIDTAKGHLNDVANALGADGDFDGLGGTGSDDNQYESIMLDNILATGEQTLTLQKRTTGVYTYGSDMSLWFATPAAPFTGENDVEYKVYGKGLKVLVTSGTPTATEISIIGAQVDFNSMMADMFLWWADTKAVEIALSIESETIDPGAVRDACVEHARLWQGVITSAT
jgi:hypothetical protein